MSLNTRTFCSFRSDLDCGVKNKTESKNDEPEATESAIYEIPIMSFPYNDVAIKMDSDNLHGKNDNNEKHVVPDKCTVKRDIVGETNDIVTGNHEKNQLFPDDLKAYPKGLCDETLRIDEQENSMTSYDKQPKYICKPKLSLLPQNFEEKEKDKDKEIIRERFMGRRIKERVRRSKSLPNDLNYVDDNRVKRSNSWFSKRPNVFHKTFSSGAYSTPTAKFSSAKDKTLMTEPVFIEGENTSFSEQVCKEINK